MSGALRSIWQDIKAWWNAPSSIGLLMPPPPWDRAPKIAPLSMVLHPSRVPDRPGIRPVDDEIVGLRLQLDAARATVEVLQRDFHDRHVRLAAAECEIAQLRRELAMRDDGFELADNPFAGVTA